MLSIIASGDISLDLPKDAVMEFNLENPAFSDDFLSGSYSQTITLPFTKTNDRFFNNARHLEVKRRIKTYDNVLVKYKNMPLYIGKLNLMRINDKGYEVSFSINGFVLDIFGKNLKDVNYGADFYLGDTQKEILAKVKDVALSSYPNYNFNFPPVENKTFYGSDGLDLTTGSNPDYLGKINNYDVPADKYVLNTYDTGTISVSGTTHNYNTLVPFLYLHFIIEKAMEWIGSAYEGDFILDAEFRTLLVYNNNSLDSLRPFGSPMKPPPYAYGGTGSAGYTRLDFNMETGDLWQDSAGLWDNTLWQTEPITTAGSYTFNVSLTIREGIFLDASDNFLLRMLVDSGGVITVTDINITSFVDLIAISVLGPVIARSFTPTLVAGDIVWFEIFISGVGLSYLMVWEGSVEIISPDPYTSLIGMDNVNVNRHNKYVHYLDHVPDMTISDFLKEIVKIPGVYLTFSPLNKKVKFNYRKDIFRQEILQIQSSRVDKPWEIKLRDYGMKFSYDWSGDGAANFKDISGYTYLGEIDLYSSSFPTADKQMVLEIITGTYLVSIEIPIFGWTWIAYCPKEYAISIGTGEKEVKSLFSPVIMTDAVGNLRWVMPKVESIGNSARFDQTDNSSPLKLMFYRGFETFNVSHGSYTCPFATSLDRDPAGASSYNYSLFWAVPNKGMYYLFWKEWAEFVRNADPVQLMIDLDIPRLKAVNHDNRLAIWRDLFFWQKITTQIGDGGVEQTRGDLFQVKPKA